MNVSFSTDKANIQNVCNVCGEKEFREYDGYYYCLECGTKEERIRVIETDTDVAFGQGVQYLTKHTIKKAKKEPIKLTTWECYNYILHGLVHELLSFGAKDSLKRVAVQVWAAFLKTIEVAFFRKTDETLPKLGMHYHKVDAETVYNHKILDTKTKNKQKPVEESSKDRDEISNKNWRKSKRELDKYLYAAAMASATSASSRSNSSNTTTRTISLYFNRRAQKCYKKLSRKHEDVITYSCSESSKNMKFYKPLKRAQVHYADHALNVMNMKQIYSVLAIALNLIRDDIQLSDLVRFIQEGAIGTKNVLNYFPENITQQAPDVLQSIDFYKHPHKYSDKCLRDHISLLCKNIGIKRLKAPDMMHLVERYITELCLPNDLSVFIARLINVLPPKFHMRVDGGYPAYEARAMAYIMFAMKLLFGLDGHKEKYISICVKEVNKKIREFNKQYEENAKPIFDWNEWVQYIEMRKLIISHFNSIYCKQLKQEPRLSQFIHGITEECNAEDEEFYIRNHVKKLPLKQRREAMTSIFEIALKSLDNDDVACKLEFEPSLTPSYSYFKTILTYLDNANHHTETNTNVMKIPTYMRRNYSNYNIKAFVEPQSTINYFQSKGYRLDVIELPVTSNQKYIGIFRAPKSAYKGLKASILRVQKANFDINEEDWQKFVDEEVAITTGELQFKTELETYSAKYLKSLRTSADSKCRSREFNIDKESTKKNKSSTDDASSAANEHNLDLENMTNGSDIDTKLRITKKRKRRRESCQGSENRKDVKKTKPTGNMDNVISDENRLIMHTSSMDYWLLMGSILMLKKNQKQQLLDKFPMSFTWLLETCANMLGVDWSVVFEQLLVIELMFGIGVENIDDEEKSIHFKYNNRIKDFNMLGNTSREIW